MPGGKKHPRLKDRKPENNLFDAYREEYLRSNLQHETLTPEEEREHCRRIEKARRSLLFALCDSPAVVGFLAAVYASASINLTAAYRNLEISRFNEVKYRKQGIPDSKIRELKKEFTQSILDGCDFITAECIRFSATQERFFSSERAACYKKHEREYQREKLRLVRRILSAQPSVRIQDRLIKRFIEKEHIIFSSVPSLAPLSDVVPNVAPIRAELIAAKNDLVEHNLGLVRMVVQRYRGNPETIMDRMQDGNIGLMRAVDVFEYRRGNKFSTFAVRSIRSEIMNKTGNREDMISVPRNLRAARIKLDRFDKENERNRRVASEAERREVAGEKFYSNIDQARCVSSVISYDVSYAGRLTSEDEPPLIDVIADPYATDRIFAGHSKHDLRRAMSQLRPIERGIVVFHLQDENIKWEKIGDAFNMPSWKARRVWALAMRKIRIAFSTGAPKDEVIGGEVEPIRSDAKISRAMAERPALKNS